MWRYICLLAALACLAPTPLGAASTSETNSLLVSFTSGVSRELIETLIATAPPPDYGKLPFPSLQPFPPTRLRRVVQPQSGDQAARVLAEPDSHEARLEHIVQMDFATLEARAGAHSGLLADPLVASVSVVIEQSESDEGFGAAPLPSGQASLADYQPHLTLLGIDDDYRSLGGWSLVGVLDNGIDPGHPELRSFNGNAWVQGGAYLPAFSRNISGNGSSTSNLSEAQGYPAAGFNPLCDPDHDGLLEYDRAGHGTHVAGLIAASSNGPSALRGTCSTCSLAVAKRSFLTCGPTPQGLKVQLTNSDPIDIAGYTYLIEVGSQVMNFSFGSRDNRCESKPGLPRASQWHWQPRAT